jgi:beta-lactamase class D
MLKKLYYLVIALLIGSPNALANDRQSIWQCYLESYGIKHATAAFYDEQKASWFYYNEKRASTPFIPASTYKIPHSLIALNSGVVTSHRVFAWNGKSRQYESWNKDHTLRTAIKYSVVPVFQTIAKEIGITRMQHEIKKLGFGNGDISGGIDSFWLTGGLRISAIQQVDFLRKLESTTLPVSKEAQLEVKNNLINEANSKLVLFAKTGWAANMSPQIGWWVGWVELDDNKIFFALNMDIEKPSQLQSRKDVGKAMLNDLTDLGDNLKINPTLNHCRIGQG